MSARWLDKLEARMDEPAERSDLEARVAKLERQVADLTEWLGTVADEGLTRAGISPLYAECG
jgi:uncharacterized protein YceH (UPF0502 family)